MRRFSGILVAISSVLLVLLATLAVVQYRWSTRVAAADAQREREHLDASAALFADEFNDLAIHAVQFLQNDARAAAESGKPLTGVPSLIGELYYVELSDQGPAQVRKLSSSGLFEAASAPAWLGNPHCSQVVIAQPAALVSPMYEFTAVSTRDVKSRMRIVQRIDGPPRKCLVARLNGAYLRSELFPQLLRKSFGESGTREYDFEVIPREPGGDPLYGAGLTPDVSKAFFSMRPILHPPKELQPPPGTNPKAFFVQRFDATIVARGQIPVTDLLGEGIWQLNIAHKGMPLAAAFEQIRRRNLLLSLAVEGLLALAIIVLVISVRRMQMLAEQKMQFVAGVSHELRTPVSAISMLSRNQADGLVAGTDKVKQYGELIHQQTRRLNEMIEQTLQYAGIHSGLWRPAKDPVDLRAVIDEAVAARRDDLSRAGFQVEMALRPDLPPVFGDAKLLRTAFDNLLSNALKHADSGRWICIRSEYSQAGKEVTVSVEDRGPGIDPATQAEIFEPFSRGEAATEAQIPGSGLGLSLVRSAVEAHRGTVTLVSAPGHGSTFTLHLPV